MEGPQPNTTVDVSLSQPRLADLKQDIEALLADPRSGGQAKQIIAEVVTDSDFVPADEQAVVALVMYERIVEAED